jgi:hypothetical protein
MTNYTLFQPNALEFMHNGQVLDDGTVISKDDWFARALDEAYTDIAAQYSCEVWLSARRLAEAHMLWEHDLTNMTITDSDTPDHFKQAGFLAYWLRRRVVVERSAEGEGMPEVIYRDDFLRYCNEWSAFLIGFRICLPFEADRLRGEARMQDLHTFRLNPEYLRDLAVLLHHKNVSPHSLYLIYRSLFYHLRVR